MVKMKKLLQGAGINLFLLSLISFLNDISSDLILAIFPFFILSLGGGGIALGLIGGLGDSLAGILKVFSGAFSDKLRRRKPLISLGYILSAIVKVFFPFVHSWTSLLFLRPLERVGKGLRIAPRDALLASSISPQRRGRGFGIRKAADSSGAVLGTLLAFIFFWFAKFNFRTILLVGAAIGFLALFPLGFLREKRPSGKIQMPSIKFIKFPVNFKKYLIAAGVFGLSNFTYMFFILRAKNVFVSVFPGRLAIAIPILLYAWFNLVYALGAFPAGVLSDRIGRKKIITIGYLIFSFTCLGLVHSETIPSFILLFAFYGVALSLISANQVAFVADMIEEKFRGTALGFFHTTISIATLFGSLIAGFLWNKGVNLPFLYGFLVSLLAAGTMIGVRWGPDPPRQKCLY